MAHDLKPIACTQSLFDKLLQKCEVIKYIAILVSLLGSVKKYMRCIIFSEPPHMGYFGEGCIPYCLDLQHLYIQYPMK